MDALPRFDLDAVDYRFARVLSTSTVAHLAFLVALLLTPLEAIDLSDGLFKAPNRFEALILTAPPRSPRFARVEAAREKPGAKASPRRFGRPETPSRDVAASEPGRVDANERERCLAEVTRVGVLGALTRDDRLAQGSVFGKDGLSAGVNTAVGQPGPGESTGPSGGLGGMHARGRGPGGGDGSALGVGALDTGSPDGDPSGFGARARKRHEVEPVDDEVRIDEGLPADVVARVVRRHESAVRYCYERHLGQDPSLQGKLAVRWVIGPTGAVTTAVVAEDTLGSPGAVECILTRVRRWKFPQPAGGSTVTVTYPWIFKRAG